MTRDDLRVLCTALGFLAVVLKDESGDDQALRAKSIARLIESYCVTTVPEAVGATLHDHLLDEAIAALELVMNDGLTFTSEQAVERTLNRLKRTG